MNGQFPMSGPGEGRSEPTGPHCDGERGCDRSGPPIVARSDRLLPAVDNASGSLDVRSRQRAAHQLWIAADPDLAPVRPYFVARGITDFDFGTADLRFHPALSHRDVCGKALPGIVGLVTDLRSSGAQTGGIHRTYLAPELDAKASGVNARLLLGTTKGGAIVLRRGDPGRVLVAEGIETAAAAYLRLTRDGLIERNTTVVAAISASGLQSLNLPHGCDVIVAADHDTNGVGRRAAEELARRAVEDNDGTATIFLPITADTDFADRGPYAAVPAAPSSSHRISVPTALEAGCRTDRELALAASSGGACPLVSMSVPSAGPRCDTGPAAGTAEARHLVIRPAVEITDTRPAPADIFFPGIAVRGEHALLGGFSGSGSSTLLLNLGVAIANGKPFLDHAEVPRGRVLIVEHEDAQWRIRERLDAIAKASRASLSGIFVADMDKSDPLSPQSLAEAIIEYKVDTVLIATFARLANGDPDFRDEIDNVAMQRVARGYSELARRLHVAIATAAHCRKGARIESFTLDDIRGGSALSRDVRMIAAFGPLGRGHSTTSAEALLPWYLKWGKENVGMRRCDHHIHIASVDGVATFRLATQDDLTALVNTRTARHGAPAREVVRTVLDQFVTAQAPQKWFRRTEALAYVSARTPSLEKGTVNKWMKHWLPDLAEPRNQQSREWRRRMNAGASYPPEDAAR